jgi:flagellar hook protein FlgE
MGIFDALNTSVGGLTAQSFALQNISGNIANSQTIGYKGIGTSFVDLIPASGNPTRQNSGSVTAFSQLTITTRGPISPSTVGTFMAITGDGFFNVQRSSGVVDRAPVFTGVTDYTRRGDFQLNANGNLVNGGGYFLMGVPVDPKTGNPLGNVPQVLQFQSSFIPAQPTTTLLYSANLPAKPATNGAASGAPNSLKSNGGLDPTDFALGHSPLVLGSSGAPFVDVPVPGAAKNNLAGPGNPIDANTVLSGAGPNALTTAFAANDTIVVDGQTITFTAAAGLSDATHMPIDGTLGQLLTKIQAITGGPAPAISAGGVVTLHTGTQPALTVTSSNAAALLAFGFVSGVNVPGTPSIGTGAVTANDQATFLDESVGGGSITAFDATGAQTNLELRWAKVDDAKLGAGHSDTWNLFYQTNPNATGTQTVWQNANTDFVFNSGKLTSPAGSSITIQNVTVGSQALGNLSFSFGNGGLTQFATVGGKTTIGQATQNGFAAGQLQSVSVNNSGIVVGNFSNGQNLDLAQVSLSHFNGTNYLKALDGGGYEVTDQSGPAIDGASGSINGSSLEGSNADIADEFTKLIVTQQAYSANTKVITTANSMVQDLLNVLR